MLIVQTFHLSIFTHDRHNTQKRIYMEYVHIFSFSSIPFYIRKIKIIKIIFAFYFLRKSISWIFRHFFNILLFRKNNAKIIQLYNHFIYNIYLHIIYLIISILKHNRIDYIVKEKEKWVGDESLITIFCTKASFRFSLFI